MTPLLHAQQSSTPPLSPPSPLLARSCCSIQVHIGGPEGIQYFRWAHEESYEALAALPLLSSAVSQLCWGVRCLRFVAAVPPHRGRPRTRPAHRGLPCPCPHSRKAIEHGAKAGSHYSTLDPMFRQQARPQGISLQGAASARWRPLACRRLPRQLRTRATCVHSPLSHQPQVVHRRCILDGEMVVWCVHGWCVSVHV